MPKSNPINYIYNCKNTVQWDSQNFLTQFLKIFGALDLKFLIQCPPLNRITLGQHKSDNNNQIIQLTDVLCVLLRYKWASKF